MPSRSGEFVTCPTFAHDIGEQFVNSRTNPPFFVQGAPNVRDNCIGQRAHPPTDHGISGKPQIIRTNTMN